MAAVPQITPITLRNILFPTDFSEASEAALPFALSLARIYGSTLHIEHTIVPEPHRTIVVDRLPAQDDRIWEDGRNRLNWFINDAELDGTPSRSLLASGDLADVIPQMIREHAIDLVVVGTRGRSGLSKMMMGSGAEKIYRSATCPVLTVGPNAHCCEWKPRRIMSAVEHAENSQAALGYALSLAEENQSELIVMQAAPMVPWQHRADIEKQTWQRLRSLVPEQANEFCTPQFLVRWEHPAEAILLAAEERRADLIVLGVRRSRAAGLSSHLPWPVASEVVSRAGCPVLTVRV